MLGVTCPFLLFTSSCLKVETLENNILLGLLSIFVKDAIKCLNLWKRKKFRKNFHRKIRELRENLGGK